MSATLAVPTATEVPWLRQVWVVARWRFGRASTQLGMIVVVQIALAVSTVLGYGLLIGEPPAEARLYLATGAATIMLMAVGLILAPQMIIESRQEGSLDWLRALPLSRVAILVADAALWTALALPGVILGLATGLTRFSVKPSLQWWTVLVFLAVAVISTGVGQGLALVLPPTVGQAVAQLLVFIVLLFSPVSFPAERLPNWLATAHSVLPFESMANLMRAAVLSETFSATLRDWLVVSAWLVAAVAAATTALSRRR